MLHAVVGVEQGDAAGPALFAAGLVEPLSELRAALQRLVEDEQPALAGCGPSTRAVAVFAYLDDTLIGVAGPHSPSTSGARRSAWGSPTVARSFISAAALPFFVCDNLSA